ncbi:hypothetical protein CPLU01_04985 [Colletotrichum plurivorum]|uniref:Uncharacterized protein n=1 Tax=Colletotrichum plurivorum TaxID=2175906 RepID=A0A8H6NI81_9PEZI|nr:hypothetical protein CPLU01_04985 [Colletotrichum plurivorum]
MTEASRARCKVQKTGPLPQLCRRLRPLLGTPVPPEAAPPPELPLSVITQGCLPLATALFLTSSDAPTPSQSICFRAPGFPPVRVDDVSAIEVSQSAKGEACVSSTPRLYARARDIRSHALPWARPSSRPFPGMLAQLRVPALGVETLPPHGAGLTYRVGVHWGDSLRARSDTYQDQRSRTAPIPSHPGHPAVWGIRRAKFGTYPAYSITRREKVGGRGREALDAVSPSDGSVGMDGGAVLGCTPELTRGTDETLGTDRDNLTVMRFAQSPPLPNTTLLGVLASLPNSRQRHSLPSSGIVAKAREQRALPFFTGVCLEEKHVLTE